MLNTHLIDFKVRLTYLLHQYITLCMHTAAFQPVTKVTEVVVWQLSSWGPGIKVFGVVIRNFLIECPLAWLEKNWGKIKYFGGT
jgi:hypothetical protein